MNSRLSCWRRGALALAIALAMSGFAVAQTTTGISIEPDTLNFMQVRGGKFAIASFVIRNTMTSGRVSGNVGSLNGVFQVENGSGSFDLGPGDFQVVSLRFTPSAPRLWTDSIAITHNVNGVANPLYVYLRGVGADTSSGTSDSTRLNLMVSPTSLNFGGVRVGQTDQRTLTITNNSASATLIGTINGGLLTGPFSLTNGGGIFSLSPGESRSTTVSFAPTAQGSASGSLMIAYSSPDSTGVQVVNLSGFGITSTEDQSDSLRVMIQPDILNFGNVRIGQTSQRSFTIRNASDTTRFSGGILPIAGTTPFSLVGSGTSALDIAAGGSRNITVQFAPTTRGGYNNNVVVGYMVNGSLVMDTIRVLGYGVDTAGVRGRGHITFSPETIDFGNAIAGTMQQRSVTITNPSSDSSVSGTVMNPAAPFYLTSGMGNFTLGPNESRTVTLSYMPTLAGSFSDNLAVNFNGPAQGEIAYLALSGTAAAAAGVEDRADLAAREGYELAPNRPNPFAAMTTIAFTIPKSGHAQLRVFNTRGEQVATLVDGDLTEGEHSIVWDASDMESGVYFYQLQSGTITVARPLTLTK